MLKKLMEVIKTVGTESDENLYDYDYFMEEENIDFTKDDVIDCFRWLYLPLGV